MRKCANRRLRRQLKRADTAIPDSGATGFYYAPGAPITNINQDGTPVVVGTASGQPHGSTTTADHQIPDLPSDFPQTGHVMRHFQDTLLGIGPICDAGCTVTFDDKAVTIRYRDGRIILGGWRDDVAPRLGESVSCRRMPTSRSILPMRLKPRSRHTAHTTFRALPLS